MNHGGQWVPVAWTCAMCAPPDGLVALLRRASTRRRMSFAHIPMFSERVLWQSVPHLNLEVAGVAPHGHANVSMRTFRVPASKLCAKIQRPTSDAGCMLLENVTERQKLVRRGPKVSATNRRSACPHVCWSHGLFPCQ